jgi:uncharacterized membrane protein YedE/YeeE
MKNEAIKQSLLAEDEQNIDFKICSLDIMGIDESRTEGKWYQNIKYSVIGSLFGVVLIKGQVISWVRIQEMFRLQSFHLYGIIGTAVVVGIISVLLVKKFNIKTIYGESIEFHKKEFNKGQIYGGLLFGLGWGLTGACPGAIFAQIGTGASAVIVVLLSALAGTWVYGYLRDKLPH